MSILEIRGLQKSFKNQMVIDGLSLTVPENSIFGFVGKNGAGKTTTMKMVLGLLRPDNGSIRVCGEMVTYGETKTNQYIGYLPDVPEFYAYMKPAEYLKLCGEITGMSAGRIRRKSAELLESVGLAGVNKRIGGFSRGMKQRLGIAQALLNEPKLLICDEPTSALDPIGRKEILDILQQVKGKSTVVFSTHILSDVERVCDRVAVLNNGKLALNGTLADLKARHTEGQFLFEFATEDAAQQFLNLGAVQTPGSRAKRQLATVNITTSNAEQDNLFWLGELARAQLAPVKFEVAEPSLESLFMEVVQ